MSVCENLCQQACDDPNFMLRIITGDERWVYSYDPETTTVEESTLPKTEEDKAGQEHDQERICHFL